ncbi:pilus assembly protein TadG-related protein [Blastococcus sp. CCUG 61487]|uniref:pilus assembly protein TadG-related protein n=1 Tax=Blastococcus sp. CCUG 61487 TaxID=1840703 RepID=UPI0010C0CD7E|nr:pilus assembly protein TadG-related protein [Blastococcus sp. CCUG 61487]TKJ20646.1 hypothetical protein A6V29_08345 [Blastococcus sp. CCUG 61487]
MRRLTFRSWRERARDERGAVGVMVALMMVPLLGCAAIAIDVSALRSEQQQLRNGADAAALAIATDCAWNDCGDTAATAGSLVTRNSGQVGATLATPSVAVDLPGKAVSVTARAAQRHWFAPVLGHDSSTVSATSTAAWGGISRATADMPVAISRCHYEKLARGAAITLYPGEAGVCGTGSSAVPALIWLNTGTTACKVSNVAVGATLSRYVPTSRTDMPTACRPSGMSFPLSNMVGKQVHIPVFDQATATSAPTVYGFVAFDVDDVKVNERSFKVTNWWQLILWIIAWWFDRLPEDHGFKAIGSIGTSVVLSDAPVQNPAPDLGARAVFLTER